MGEPPSFSGKNQFSLHESLLRFSAVKGMPTGPGTSEERDDYVLIDEKKDK